MTAARRHRRGVFVAVLTATLVACTSSADPGASQRTSGTPPASRGASDADPGASPTGSRADVEGWRGADLYAVVTGNSVDTLVGIDVEARTVKPLVVLEPNEPKLSMDGGMQSPPPSSSVLFDAQRSTLLLWTRPTDASTVTVRELDPLAGQVRDVGAPPHTGQLPFLYEGKLAWATVPGPGEQSSQLVSTEAGFEISLPGIPFAIVEGPGTGRITAAVILPNNQDRVVTADVATRKVTTLPTPPVYLGHRGGVTGTLWADEDRLLASVYARLEPTVDDPENGEPDKTFSVLTWSVDAGGSNAQAVAGLVPGRTLGTTELYATNVVRAGDEVAVVTGTFDEPWVEAIDLDSGKPVWKLDLATAEFVTSMTVSGTTLVVLQSRHATFIDLASHEPTTAELGGITMTTWEGRYGR